MSTDFAHATVVDARANVAYYPSKKTATVFELVVDLRLAATSGGLVAPGVHPI